MSLRAIFRFENLDSTKDLNDRFSGLFKAGIYEGGAVKINSSNTAAIVEPFKAMTADGMAVISDEEIVVPNIASTTINIWIVLEAYYVIDANPVMKLKVIDREQNIDPSIHVRLAKKISTTSYDYLNDGCVDKLDPISRNHYRGVLTSNEFNTQQDNFAVYDWCFEVSPSSVIIKLKLQNGFAYYTSSNVIDNRIDNHIQNDIDNTAGYVADMGGAGSDGGVPHIMQDALEVLEGGVARKCDIGTEKFGSFNITSNKWFALDSIKTKWTQATAGCDYTSSDYPSSTLGDFISAYYEGGSAVIPGTHSRGIRFNDVYHTSLPSQEPNVNVRFITEQYPLIPTLDEKYALVGNYDNVSSLTNPESVSWFKPSQDNRFVTQRTGTLKLKTLNGQDVTSDSHEPGDPYYYEIELESNEYVFLNSLGDMNKYIKVEFDYEGETGEHKEEIFLQKSGGGTSYITNNDFVNASDTHVPPEYYNKCLRLSSFIIKSYYRITSVQAYVLTTIGNTIPDYISPESSYYKTQRISFYRSDDALAAGALRLDSNSELEFVNSKGTYKVMLIKQ